MIEIIILIIMALLVWYMLGVGSFIFWWTTDFDFTSEEYILAFIYGFFGPTAFILGWLVHSKNSKNKIIVKKRL